MARYELLVGFHYDKERKRYKPGAVIESDVDLEAKHGPKKFRKLERSRAPVSDTTDATDTNVGGPYVLESHGRGKWDVVDESKGEAVNEEFLSKADAEKLQKSLEAGE